MDIETLNATIIDCRKCPRLVEYRELVACKKKKAYRDWVYWGRPVPAFGDVKGRVLVVGLAPGPHGSNRTGRMFTGDASGVFLYAALHRAGYVNQANSLSRDDGLKVSGMLISAVCRCVPPDNKPNRSEIDNCLPYLEQEIKLMQNLKVIVALGRIGFENVLRVYRSGGNQLTRFDFKHGGINQLGENLPWLVASYHPSQQNTQTGRLTVAMFDSIWQKVHQLLS
jgi:uracil-DNA glycosylase